MSTKPGKLFIGLMLILVGTLASSCAIADVNSKAAPLVIQEQGSFAIGGTVITAPGTYDPITQGAYNPTFVNPEGQTFQAQSHF